MGLMKIINGLNAQKTCAMLAFGALLLTVGAFVLEHGFNVQPCQMCWWQRYAHWGIGVVATLGVWRWHFWMLGAVADIALIGGGIALWQALAEHGLAPLPESCRSAGVELVGSASDLLAQLSAGTIKAPPACDEVSFRLLGLSLAEWNVLAMASFAALALTIIIKEWKKWI